MTQTLSTRTVCCKLSLDADAATTIQATAVQFNAAATYCAQVAWAERITNKNKLHHVVYGPTRVTYGLGAQLACCARDKAAAAGVLLVAVDPRDTSRTCAECGHCQKANRVDQAHFRCLSCGHTAAADTNAAVNIALRAASQTAYRAAPATQEEQAQAQQL